MSMQIGERGSALYYEVFSHYRHTKNLDTPRLHTGIGGEAMDIPRNFSEPRLLRSLEQVLVSQPVSKLHGNHEAAVLL